MVSDVLVLCTRNRPAEVRNCLDRVRVQTACADPGARRRLQRRRRDRADRRRLSPGWPPARCRAPGPSRDSPASGRGHRRDRPRTIVHFVDDDTVLEPGTSKRSSDLRRRCTGRRSAGSAGSSPISLRTVPSRRRVARARRAGGRGGAAVGSQRAGPHRARVRRSRSTGCPGCAMSYRRAVFETRAAEPGARPGPQRRRRRALVPGAPALAAAHHSLRCASSTASHRRSGAHPSSSCASS